MSVLDWIVKIAGTAGPELVSLLNSLKAKYPDSAKEIDAVLAKLAEAVNPANLASVGKSVISELADLGQGKTSGKFHPGDLA